MNANCDGLSQTNIGRRGFLGLLAVPLLKRIPLFRQPAMPLAHGGFVATSRPYLVGESCVWRCRQSLNEIACVYAVPPSLIYSPGNRGTMVWVDKWGS